MKQYSFHYGHGTKSFTLDENKVMNDIRMPETPVMENVAQGVLDVIYHPIGMPPINELIKPGQTVTFICNDPTRVANSFDFMPVLVNEMNKLGIPDENMQIVFSLGTHRLMTKEEMAEGVGEEVARRIKMFNSDANVPEDFEYFGATGRFTPVLIHKRICHSDHVILTGTIVHHYFSGYGGGRKAVLPGCAAMETVRNNHSFMLDPNSGLGKTTGNPVYEDQMEGVALWVDAMKKRGCNVFLFNAILDAEHHFLRMFAGHYIDAHIEACKFVDQVYGVKIKKQADVVIVSCGGYPKDINVYQMQKTMDNSVLACRQGGVVILLAECEEGSGSKVLEETCQRLKTADAIEEELKKRFVIGANKAYAVTRLTKKAHFILVTGLDKKMAQEMLFTDAVGSVEEALAEAEKIVGKDYSVILMPTGSLTVPLLEG